MEIAVDLHIHSALSPCADDEMSPNNIVNMAILKELDAIAVTDHNSCDNIEAILKVADSKILIVPGMEVQTKEEVHLLCYFKNVENLLEFGGLIKNKLPDIMNVAKIFGNQLIMNEFDETIGERECMLISSVDLSMDEVLEEVSTRDGIIVPAHVDRHSFSVISQLGFIPDNFKKGMLEVNRNGRGIPFDYPKEKLYYSSDAHNLSQILERETYLEVSDLSINEILRKLSGEN
ncbi:MAG TPA: PHP domain-containing protein [Clostridia bacterium]|nr:PHP domain-containing protein [Clostridia bacterium]